MAWTASRRRPSIPRVAHEVEQVLDEVAPHAVAARPVDVHRLAPRRGVAVGEVGGEALVDGALRAEVVVDDVDHDRDAGAVRLGDEVGQALRAAVAGLDGEGEDAVVAPVPGARELADRHQLDGGVAGVGELAERRRHPGEGPLGAERPDVQLAEHLRPERHAAPAGDVRRLQRDDGGGAVDALGLRTRRRVGVGPAPIEQEAVAGAGHGGRDRRVVAAAGRGERRRDLVAEDELDRADLGREHAEAGATAAEVGRPVARRQGAGAPRRHAQRRPRAGESASRPSGGRVHSRLAGWPCQGGPSASTAPALPTPEPP